MNDGDVFNHWTVLIAYSGENGRAMCRCVCGVEKLVYRDTIKNGKSTSCGCMAPGPQRTVSDETKKMQASWRAMMARCNNPNIPQYVNYGGRGIKVCERWLNFNNFLEDVGYPPFPRASLDRIDNDKGYCLENVRWATAQEQGRNKRNNRFFEYEGRSMLLRDWAKEFNIKPATLNNRIYTCEWSLEKALTTPVTTR